MMELWTKIILFLQFGLLQCFTVVQMKFCGMHLPESILELLTSLLGETLLASSILSWMILTCMITGMDKNCWSRKRICWMELRSFLSKLLHITKRIRKWSFLVLQEEPQKKILISFQVQEWEKWQKMEKINLMGSWVQQDGKFCANTIKAKSDFV